MATPPHQSAACPRGPDESGTLSRITSFRLGTSAVTVFSLEKRGERAMAYTALFAFGDSLSDAGNDWIVDGHTDPVSPYYRGHFSNGLTWVEDLYNMLGLGTLKPSLAGGNDFAFGGAETGPTAVEGVNPGDLLFQVAQYAALHPTPVGGALYTLDIGGNDIFKALDEFHAGQISPSVAARPSPRPRPTRSTPSSRCLRSARATSCSTRYRIWGWPPISAPKDRPGKISPAVLRSPLIRRCSPTSSRSSTWASRSTICPLMLTSIWSPASPPTLPPNTASASQM